MGIVPMLIEQGLSVPEFITYTFKTNALGIVAVFAVSQTLFTKLKERGNRFFKHNYEVVIGSAIFTVIAGPFIIEWLFGTYEWLNRVLGDVVNDAFFRVANLA